MRIIIRPLHHFGNKSMTTLDRHSWSRKFKSWLTDGHFEHQSQHFARPGGNSELLMMGRLKDSTRPTVIFIHGLGNDALFPNVAFFRKLLISGYNIATTDLDGHGRTSSSQLSSTSAGSLIDDLVFQLDHSNLSATKYHFCGYSLGAVLQLNYAVHKPERVCSLTLIGMPTGHSARILISAELLTPFCESYREAISDYGALGIHPAVGPVFRGRYPVRMSESEQGHYLTTAAKIIAMFDPYTQSGLVTVPTLNIVGSLDFIANPSTLRPAAISPKSKTVILAGETHFSSMLCQESASAAGDFISSLAQEARAL
jgi:pimeloyl-ACP methyl ester carboxylesterase